MSPIATLLWISNLFIDTFGQLSFKAAANGPSPDGIIERWKMLLSNYWLWLGIGTYVIEFFVYLAFLSYVPLAQGLLVGSLNIVAVMVGGRIFFKEELTANRLLAITLIATGVTLVGWGADTEHQGKVYEPKTQMQTEKLPRLAENKEQLFQSVGAKP